MWSLVIKAGYYVLPLPIRYELWPPGSNRPVPYWWKYAWIMWHHIHLLFCSHIRYCNERWNRKVGGWNASIHNLSDHDGEQKTCVLKTVYKDWESVRVRMRTKWSCYVHRHTTAPCPREFWLCFCMARSLHFENNGHCFCDTNCHGHTKSRPEWAFSSLLASPGKLMSLLSFITNTLSHFALLSGSLRNGWKEVLRSWIGLLPRSFQAYFVILVYT